jgi:hypothetical protein
MQSIIKFYKQKKIKLRLISFIHFILLNILQVFRFIFYSSLGKAN